ncbi:type VII secretion protein EssB/YukC [Thalassobacillus hwangdonensis]|uniref:Type VII secretion protein EssB/YukC n=1 Tax=Thalassobacillus hwangdonensis TaxID=546108 RepID=A0ABW3KXK7_9BACI
MNYLPIDVQWNDKERTVNVVIPTNQTKMIENEQLAEFEKKSDYFFNLSNVRVNSKQIEFIYGVEQNYYPLSSLRRAPLYKVLGIIQHLFVLEELYGSQFNPLINPDNIFYSNDGTIKVAHRGLRGVIPPLEDTKEALFHEMKACMLSLFSRHSFDKIMTEGPDSLIWNESTVAQNIAKAGSLAELKAIVLTEKKKADDSRQTYLSKRGKIVALIGALMVGFLLGLATVFLWADQAEGENNEQLLKKQVDQVAAMKDELQQKEARVDAYEAMLAGEHELAVERLLSLENRGEFEEGLLLDAYLQLETAESLQKAAELDASLHPDIVLKLLAMNTDASRQVLMNMESEAPEVLIEQAYFNKDYEKVLSLNDTLDNSRSKRLAAHSHFELDQIKEAEALAKEVNDKGLQLKILTIKKEKIENNDKLDEDEKKEQLKKINEQIKELQ